MKKCIKKITRYLNNWLKENDFECLALYDLDFSFDCINDVIYYSFVVTGHHDELFLKICQEYKPEIGNCDNFILSFFHELGHFETQHLFTEKEWEDYDKLIDSLGNKKDFTDEDYLKYYKHPIEMEATMWACDYIVSNSDKVEKWWKDVKLLINEFYEHVGYENEESDIKQR